jgi:hypothetical protein
MQTFLSRLVTTLSTRKHSSHDSSSLQPTKTSPPSKPNTQTAQSERTIKRTSLRSSHSPLDTLVSPKHVSFASRVEVLDAEEYDQRSAQERGQHLLALFVPPSGVSS